MSEIPIHIRITQEGADTVAEKIQALTRALTDLTQYSEALARPLASVSRSFVRIGRGVSGAFQRLSTAMPLIARHIDTLEQFENTMTGVKDESGKLGQAMLDLQKSTQYQPEIWNRIRDNLKRLGIATEENMGLVNRAEQAYKEISRVTSGFGISVSKAYALFKDAAQMMGVGNKELADAILTVDKATKSFGVSISMTPENVLRAAEGIKTFNTIMNKAGITVEEGVRRFPELYEQMIRGIPVLDRVGMNMDNFASAVKTTYDVMNQFGIQLRTTPANIVRVAAGMNTFRDAMRQLNLSIEEGMMLFPEMFTSLMRGTDRSVVGFREMIRASRELRMGLHLLTRQMFWIGLGTMFLTMSFDRLRRREIQVARYALTYVRTLLRLQEIQEEYSRTVQEYGATSEEARRTLRRLRLEEESLRLQLETTRHQVEQTAFAWMMMISSTVGQVIGAGEMISTAFGMITLAQMRATAAQEMWNISQSKGLAAAFKMFAGLTMANQILGMTTRQLLIAKIAADLFWGTITLGVSALISWGISQLMVSRQMADFEERVESLRRRIGILQTGRSPGLIQAVETMNAFRESLSRMSSETRMTEMTVSNLQRVISKGFSSRLYLRETTEREESTRRVYEEIRHIREGLGIHSPGLKLEIPELETVKQPTTVINIGPININAPSNYSGLDRIKLLRDVEEQLTKSLIRRKVL